MMQIKAKPISPIFKVTIGENRLNLGENRDGVLYIPSSYCSTKPMPLLVFLHGTGGSISNLKKFYSDAENFGIIGFYINS